jgi:hypothetical protein
MCLSVCDYSPEYKNAFFYYFGGTFCQLQGLAHGAFWKTVYQCTYANAYN